MWFRNKRTKAMAKMLENINKMRSIINKASEEGRIAHVVAADLYLRLIECTVTLAELDSKETGAAVKDFTTKELNKNIKKFEKRKNELNNCKD